MRSPYLCVCLILMAMGGSSPVATAQTYYWDGSQSNTWTTLNGINSNWSTAQATIADPGAVPGSGTTVVFALTPTAAGSPRALNLNTLLGTDFGIAGLQFLSASGFGPTAVNIGASAGTTQTLTLGSGGLTIASGAGPVSFLPSVALALSANQTWTNNSANALVLNNAITSAGNSLTFSGTGAVTVGGAISNSGTAAVTKTGANTLTLAGNNGGWAGTGGFAITGGAVVLDYSSTTASKFSGPLTLGSTSLTLQGNGANAVTQNAGGLSLTGGSTITVTAPTAALNFALGAITRPAITVGANSYVVGGVNVVLPLNGSVSTTTANTNPSILGAWATVGGTDWAVSAGSGVTPGAITALGTYQTSTAFGSWVSTDNVSLSTTPVTGITTTTINSLRFTAGVTTHTVNAGSTLTIASGGILVTGAANPTFTSSSTTAATLQPGAGADWIFTNTSSNPFNLSSGNLLVLANPASGAASNLIKNGSGTVSVGGVTANTFGGPGKAVIINGGILALAVDANYGNNNNIVILNGGRLGFSAGMTSSTIARSITVNDVPGGGLDYTSSGAANLAYSGVVSGPGSITLTRSGAGTGTMVLANTANTFGGPGQSVTFASGTAYVLAAAAADSLGNANNAIVLTGGSAVFGGTAAGVTSTMPRPITLAAAGSIGVSSGWTLNLTGAITGGGGLTVNGTTSAGGGATTLVGAPGSTSVVQLNGDASAFTGGLTVTNGQVKLGPNFIAPATGFGGLTLGASNGVFDLGGFSISTASLGSLSSTFQITNTGSAATITTLGASTFNGTISAVGTINIVKSGTLQFTYGATNPYTGSTTVIGGTLSIGTAGQITGSSGVTVGNGAALQVNNASQTPFGGAGTVTSITTAPAVPLSLGGTGYSGGALTGTLDSLIGPTTVATGASTVTTAAGKTLAFASLARNAGATVTFAATGTNAVTAGANVNGIVGPWATAAGTDFATYSGTSIVALNTASATNAETGWTDPAANVLITAAGQTLTAARSMNTLRNTTASGTINLGASGAFNLSTNAILNGSGQALTITRSGTSTGIVQPASGNEFYFLGANSVSVQVPFSATTVTSSNAASPALTFATNTVTDLYVNTGTLGSGGIASFGSAAANGTSAAAVANATALVFASVSGFAVGNTLTGPGLAAGTKIAAIDTGTNTVTLSAGLTAAVGSGNQFAVPSGGTINLNGGAISFTSAITSTLVKAVVVSGGGRITPAITGSVTTFDTANITVNTNATLTFGNPGNNTSAGTINLNPTGGKITGPGAVTYGGGSGSFGTIFSVSGANDYSGGTTFSSGNGGSGGYRVNFNTATAFGTGTITLPAGNGGLSLESLQALSPNLTIANPIVSQVSVANSYFNLGGSATNDFALSGPISLQSAQLLGFAVAANRTITLGGNISEVGGSRPVTVLGAGALVLAGANAYTGATATLNGNLIAGGNAPSGQPGAFGNATSTVVVGDVRYALSPVKAASTANLSSLSGVTAIDGVTLAAGDRVLLKNQTTASQNGVYAFSGGTLTRASDLNTDPAAQYGVQVRVTNGTTQANNWFYINTTGTITLGTTAFSFANEPAVTSANAAGLLVNGPYTVARNITVQSSGGGSYTLGGTTAHASAFTGTIVLGSAPSAPYSGSANATLTAAAGGTVAFGGVISDTAGTTNPVTKTGAGTVALNAVNTYAGPTLVNAGTLGGTGTIPATIAVNPGGTLRGDSGAGTGSLAVGPVTVVGANAAGGAIATQLVVSAGLVSANSKLAVGGVSNAIAFDTTGGPFTIVLLNDAGLTSNAPQTITLATGAAGTTYAGLAGPFNLVSGSGTNTFSGYSLSASGNNLQLSFTPTSAVPEPAGVLALAGGLLAAMRRRKRVT